MYQLMYACRNSKCENLVHLQGAECPKCLEEGLLGVKVVSAEEIEKPARYNKGKIEVWDFILDQGLGFLDGNVVKYLCRKGKKDGASVLQDLKKARVYLDKLIAEEEKKS